MTKEEAIDIILQNYKDCVNKGKKFSYLCEGIVCDECPFNSDRCIFNTSVGIIEPLIKVEEHQETNLEHYRDSFYPTLLDNAYKAYKDSDYETMTDWLLAPYKPPTYKLTQFEYDLLEHYKRYDDTPAVNTFKVWTVLMYMREKGYYKDIPEDTKIRDVLDNAEVIE